MRRRRILAGLMTSMIGRASRLALDLLFPPQCALCGCGGALLCDACAAALPEADGARCERCWMPVSGGPVCRHCVDAPPAFESVRAAFVMEEGARRLAHELKYEGLTALAEPMAALMVSCSSPPGADLVVPVPLHRRRERSRGYNQSAALAKHLAAAYGLAYDDRGAKRVRDTAPLAKTMHRDERRAIVAGAFVAASARVEGRHVVLVDDVVTTGATLDACASAILEAGAAAVNCRAWARAD
jgi:ComF family protein